jgi:4-deoxy-L-threo-5-hexosulose-uronate ketol-isomerase
MSKAPRSNKSGRLASSPSQSNSVPACKTQPNMPLELRDLPGPAGFSSMKTAELRAAFLIEDLFVSGEIRMLCWQSDRAIIGAAVPGRKAIPLPNPKELAAAHFTQRRELGIVNIGRAGCVRMGPNEIILKEREAVYIGRGTPDISFSSKDPANPAQFYFVSYPAHAAYPCAKIDEARMESAECGSDAGCNRRTIHKLIHPAGVASCQLTMGLTRLAEGSVWNTMPAHRHGRRSEIYLYFDLPKDGIVVHCMGEPKETRHIIMRNRQVVLSPSWSLHFGAGTTNYSFIWAMGGENQEFTDMDAVPMEELM